MVADFYVRTFKFQPLQQQAKFVLTGDILNTEEQLVSKLCLTIEEVCVCVSAYLCFDTMRLVIFIFSHFLLAFDFMHMQVDQH